MKMWPVLIGGSLTGVANLTGFTVPVRFKYLLVQKTLVVAVFVNQSYCLYCHALPASLAQFPKSHLIADVLLGVCTC
jgi:hypothetical protein